MVPAHWVLVFIGLATILERLRSEGEKVSKKQLLHLRMVKYWKIHGELSFSFVKVIKKTVFRQDH